MAKTLQELLANRSPESQARIQKMADELLLENHPSIAEASNSKNCDNTPSCCGE